MGIVVENDEGVAVLRLIGNLRGGDEGGELRAAVQRLVEDGATRVLIDLREVGMVNSVGIGTLVACLTSVRRVGGELKLLGAPQRLLTALKICRILEVCEHYPDKAQAIHSFGPFSI